jgi:hypothetical protein
VDEPTREQVAAIKRWLETKSGRNYAKNLKRLSENLQRLSELRQRQRDLASAYGRRTSKADILSGILRPSINGAFISGLDQLAKAIATFRSAADDAIAQNMKDAAVADAQELIDRARKFMKESKLGYSACNLYEAGRWGRILKILNVTDYANESVSIDQRAIGFNRNGKRWKFTLKQDDRRYFKDEGYCSGTLTVTVGGKRVLTISVRKSLEDHESLGGYETWQPSDVLAITLGRWAIELAEMDIEVKIAEKERLERFRTQMIAEHAKRIKL